MYSYKNERFHSEIRKWDTKQLIEVLESNGLGDCCGAIETREIDGDTFLNLTEGQLAFWRLSNVQTRRLWSYIQLAREKPQDFITNLPQSTKPTPTATLNTRKIKSPIAESLNNLIGQQNNPTPVIPPQQLEVPEGNYPKVMPPLHLNDFQQRAPPRPDVLPPKPSNFQNKRIPVPPTSFANTPPAVSNYPKPPGPPTNIPQLPQHEEEDFYEEEPMAQPQNDFQPPVNPVRPTNFPNRRVPVPPPEVLNSPQDISSRLPFGIPQPSPPALNSYPRPPGPPIIPQLPQHEEEDVYEEEPVAQHQNNFKKSPVNQSSLYSTPPSNPVPVRKVVPTPTNYGRPLPSPPKDETPFPLPPNVVPIGRNVRSPLPPEVPDFPRPPAFRPPTNIPSFHEPDVDNDDDEQPEYDSVDEVQIPEYKRQSWFKDIERKEAGRILRGYPNGTFIARPSRKPEYECTFSVIYDTKIYNLAVVKQNGKFVLGKNSFNSVMDIVEKFFENPLVLNGPNNEDIYVTLKKY